MIRINLPLEPQSWQAPKFGWGYSKGAKRPRAYSTQSSIKELTRNFIREQFQDAPYDGYVTLFFHFVFKPPQSASKARRASMLEGRIIPTKKDCTNMVKFYEDCLKKIVITDDRNVASIFCDKVYGEESRVSISVYKLRDTDN